MRNEVKNITTLALFASEVETFFKVVERWNRVVSVRDDIDSLVSVTYQDWSSGLDCCLVEIQCNNSSALFQIGRLFAEERMISTLR